jgi:hypothetical protein
MVIANALKISKLFLKPLTFNPSKKYTPMLSGILPEMTMRRYSINSLFTSSIR